MLTDGAEEGEEVVYGVSCNVSVDDFASCG